MTPRRLGPADLDAIDAIKPSDWPPYRATFERYCTLDGVSTYGWHEDGQLLSMGSLIAFGRSGWLAQIITHERARGRGLASRMVAYLLQEATRRGLETVSLVATELGYPLYAKAGFRVEGEYSFWARPTPAPSEAAASAGLRPLVDGDHEGLYALDRAASGEEREPYLRGKTDGWTGARADGFWLPGIGEGLVVARTEAAGVPLLHRRLDGASRVVFPTENEGAVRVASERGFELVQKARRMVWGKSLVRQPAWVWSRVGGNLG